MCLLIAVVFLFSPVGLGGGLLYVPILHYVAKLPFQSAILGSLVLVLCTALGSGKAHQKERMVETKNVKIASMVALPGAVLGSIVSLWLLERESEFLVKLMAMSLTSWVLYTAIKKMRDDAKGDAIIGNLVPRTFRVGSGIGGFCSGMLGIGGGAIYVTMNRGWGGLSAHRAAGTSFVTAVFVLPVAMCTHILMGGFGDLADLDLFVLILTPIMALVSSFIGGKNAVQHLSEQITSVIFVVLISLSILQYVADLFRII